MKRLVWFALASLSTIAVGATANAARTEVLSYKAEMNGNSEVPANQSKGMGSVTVTYDAVEKKLSWKGSYSALTGQVTAAHFHGPAVAGKNAGIAIGIASGNLPAAFEGSATLTEIQAADLMAGRRYIDLHTAAHPAGEIRGQVVK